MRCEGKTHSTEPGSEQDASSLTGDVFFGELLDSTALLLCRRSCCLRQCGPVCWIVGSTGTRTKKGKCFPNAFFLIELEGGPGLGSLCQVGEKVMWEVGTYISLYNHTLPNLAESSDLGQKSPHQTLPVRERNDSPLLPHDFIHAWMIALNSLILICVRLHQRCADQCSQPTLTEKKCVHVYAYISVLYFAGKKDVYWLFNNNKIHNCPHSCSSVD